MSWHDSRIYGLIIPSFNAFDFKLNIDYILKRIPSEKENPLNF